MNLTNKVALVTGSSRGIGRSIALTLADAGAKVVINSRSRGTAIDQLEKELTEKKCEHLTIIGDVADHSFVKESVKTAVEKFGRIDILVNNAGIVKDNLILNMSAEEFSQVLDTNLKGTFLFTKEILPQMISQRAGKIINMSSISGHLGTLGQANYAASKAAINAFTKTTAKEIGRYNVTVNSISPGFVDTEVIETVPKEELAFLKKRIPLRRFAKPQEISNLVLFLSSDLCPYIHGENIVVDGGGF